MTNNPQWTPELLGNLAALAQATAEAATKNTEAIANHEQRINQSGDRLSSFIFEAQRLFNRLGERQERIDASIQTMSDAITRLTNISIQNSQAIREMQANIEKMQTDTREMQAEVRGLQIENRRILQRVFGDVEGN